MAGKQKIFLSNMKWDEKSHNDCYGLSEDILGFAVDPFYKKEHIIRRFTFANNHKMIVQVINFGATITRIVVPDKDGFTADVVLGFEDIKDYTQPYLNRYIGGCVGRVANRIANGKFTLNEREIQLRPNWKFKHTLHGGEFAFNRVIWDVEFISRDKCELRLKHTSFHGHEGFPGTVTATIDFKLTESNEFQMKFKATTDMPTPVSLTNHTYFNLNGHATGRGKVLDHQIQIYANEMLETDEDLIPTGKLLDVTGTPFDFRKLSGLGRKMMNRHSKGYDNYYCLMPSPDDSIPLRVVAIAVDVIRGIKLTVVSDQKGLQFYTAEGLPDPKTMAPAIMGKDRAAYVRQCAFCFLPHGYPDAVNHPNFPSVILNPKETYENNLIYKFTVE